MLKSKLIACLCGLAIVCVSFVGCSGKSGLSVATNAEFEPFEFMQNNEIVGFDVDLMNAIAEKMDVEIEWHNMEFDGVIAAVQSGTNKAAISGLTITPKRSNSVDFSEAYYTGAAQVIITKTDGGLFTGTTKSELDEQLKGKTIGVCAGFTGEAYVSGDADMGFEPVEDATVTIFDNISLAITALENGSVDAVIMDDSVAKKAVETSGNENVTVIDVPLTVEEYGIAIKKGDTELKQQIDRAIGELKADGTIDSLIQKWEIE